jgi:hypothetical protein
MKWEYKIIETGKSNKGWLKGIYSQGKEIGDNDMNQLGQEGWELVSAFAVSGSAPGFGTKANPDQVFMIFKRPIV